jgi:hypothetical protein
LRLHRQEIVALALIGATLRMSGFVKDCLASDNFPRLLGCSIESIPDRIPQKAVTGFATMKVIRGTEK